MRGFLYALATIALAVGFIALGADGYWSWKAEAWTSEPIGAYLDRIDTGWADGMRDWAADRAARWTRIVARVLAWPVWAPAFVVGGVLAVLTRRR